MIHLLLNKIIIGLVYNDLHYNTNHKITFGTIFLKDKVKAIKVKLKNKEL